jgi:acyl carrier protein
VTPDINDTVMRSLATIISKIFNVASEKISPSTTSADVSGWDSLTHTTVIMEVEEAFGVSFEIEEIFDMNSVGEMAVLIGEKKAQQ